jgi:nucleoid-associated protein YgaU
VEDTMADDKTPAGDNPYTQTHVVQSGDTLSKIAQKYYGDASLYKQIFEANRDVLKDPNKIFPGQKLKIP